MFCLFHNRFHGGDDIGDEPGRIQRGKLKCKGISGAYNRVNKGTETQLCKVQLGNDNQNCNVARSKDAGPDHEGLRYVSG